MWRDIAGLVLVVVGALVLIAGVVYAFVLAPVAAALIVGGVAVVVSGALVGRYDPAKSHADPDGGVRRSVDGAANDQAA